MKKLTSYMKNLDLLAIIMQVYTESIKIAHANNQTVGERNDYYITLEQLEAMLMRYK